MGGGDKVCFPTGARNGVDVVAATNRLPPDITGQLNYVLTKPATSSTLETRLQVSHDETSIAFWGFLSEHRRHKRTGPHIKQVLHVFSKMHEDI